MGPVDLPTHPERWGTSPPSFLEGIEARLGPFGPLKSTISDLIFWGSIGPKNLALTRLAWSWLSFGPLGVAPSLLRSLGATAPQTPALFLGGSRPPDPPVGGIPGGRVYSGGHDHKIDTIGLGSFWFSTASSPLGFDLCQT